MRLYLKKLIVNILVWQFRAKKARHRSKRNFRLYYGRTKFELLNSNISGSFINLFMYPWLIATDVYLCWFAIHVGNWTEAAAVKACHFDLSWASHTGYGQSILSC